MSCWIKDKSCWFAWYPVKTDTGYKWMKLVHRIPKWKESYNQRLDLNDRLYIGWEYYDIKN